MANWLSFRGKAVPMRAVLLLFLLSVSACAEPGPIPAPDPVTPPDAADTCGASAFAALIGQDAAMFPSGTWKGPARLIRPGQPVTMDYNPERLNVLLDSADRIVGLSCG